MPIPALIYGRKRKSGEWISAQERHIKKGRILKPGSSTTVHYDTIYVDTDMSDSDIEQISEYDCEAGIEDRTSENVLDCWDTLLLM